MILPPPAAADLKTRYGQALVWPDNLDVVDGLIACFGRSYKVAYACRGHISK